MKRFAWLLALFCLAPLSALGDEIIALCAKGDAVYWENETGQVWASGGKTTACVLSAPQDFLMWEGESLYGFSRETGAVSLILLDSGDLQPVQKLDMEALEETQDGAIPALCNPFIQDGVFHALLTKDECLLIRLDLLTGERRDVKLPFAYGQMMQPVLGGALLMGYGGDGAALYRLEGDRVQRIRSMDNGAWAFYYREETGKLYQISGNSVTEFHSLTAKEGKNAGVLPARGFECPQPIVFAPEGKLTLLLNGELVTCALDADRQARALTLPWDIFANEPEKTREFLSSHPGVELRFQEGGGYQSAEDFLLNSLDSGLDLFIMDTRLSPWTAIKEKGYALDLTGEEAIQNEIRKMYPEIQNAMSHEGRLYGVPARFDSFSLFSGFGDKLKRYGFPEEAWPETIFEMKDFLSLWSAAYREEYPNVCLIGDSNETAYVLESYFLDQYCASYESRGLPVDFDTELFRGAQEIWAGLPVLQGAEMESYCPVMYWETQLLSGKMNAVLDEWLPTLSQDQPAKLIGSLRFLFVNPKSENQDLALEYCLFVLSAMDQNTKILMMEEENTPVPNRDYDKDVAKWEGYVRETEEKLALQPEAAQRVDLERTLEDYQHMLDQARQNGEWLVSPEWIEGYRMLAKNMYLPERMFFDWDSEMPELTQNIRSLKERYHAGRISLDQYVKELNRISQMRALEDR